MSTTSIITQKKKIAENERIIYTVPEVAKLLHSSPNYIYLLIEKGYLRVELDEEGKEVDIVKKRNLALLIRQGQFVDEEVGLWDEIKEYYKALTGEGFTAKEAKSQIGQTYFDSK